MTPPTSPPVDYQARLNAMLNNLAQAITSKQFAPAKEIGSKLAAVGLLPIVNLFNLAEALNADGQRDAAIALYRLWLEKTASPVAYAVWFNLGVTLAAAQDHEGAAKAYLQAIAIKPDFIEGHLNLGTTQEKLGQLGEAVATWQKVPGFGDPERDKNFHVQAYNNLGRLLEIVKRLNQAQDYMEKALTLDPTQKSTLTHWVHIRQKQCKWPVYPEFPNISLDYMRQNTSALALLSASDDPAEQLAAAQRFVEEKVTQNLPPLAPKEGYQHPRLRIGYLSSDFCSHAVSILTAELYELHDRKRVEVYGFCWSRDDGTPLRARVVKSFDHHIRIGQMTDVEAAACIRSHEIDILVDLHGLTSGTRPDIISHRPAPVQLTYLGFPGTSALPAVDYVLADKFVLPPELAAYFTEKPAYLPRCFQINDRKRVVGPCPTKEKAGLPIDKFIFCSFNNNFKFTEAMYACWMRILQRCPHAVLWLVADDEAVKANLHQAAQQLGIDASRIIFAPRVTPTEYLARYQVADLFLDSYPFNAGTTASDALWAGLPLLTYTGRTFSSRMAGSLLNAVNLPELITYSFAEYEEKAVELAHAPDKIARMKQQLQENKLSCDLFDSPRFVSDLEDLFERLAVHPTSSQPSIAPFSIANLAKVASGAPLHASAEAVQSAQPLRSMSQTPINQIHNVDVLNMMRANYKKVVEVGSSSGALAHAYRINNPHSEYVGIEIVEEYAEKSRDYCTDVIYGDIEKLNDAEFAQLANADSWVFADALEHLYDPWKLLKRIQQHKTGPVEIIACIPNAQNWSVQTLLNSGKFVYQDAGLLDRTHIRWFTRLTIYDLFASCGFQVVNMIARNLPGPNEAQVEAIRQMANAFGHDPDQALQDAIPFQYVVKAIAA